MATLYGPFPILLPGKTESVSRNGLQKTSGTILFEAGQDGTALTLAEQNGSVFPDPQIRTTDMGLMEMSFDAYRDTGASTGVYGTEVLNLSKSFETTVNEAVGNDPPAPIPYNWTITEIWIADSFTESKVLAAELGSIFLGTSGKSLDKRMLKRTVTGKRPGGTITAYSLALTWASQVSSVTRRNFGAFDEVDIVSSLSATIG
jgi:hypothetical protein